MKKFFLPFLIIVAMSSISLPVFAQAAKDTALLGLPGDNLDLGGVLDLFLKSKTIEDFQKSLNDEKTGVNNLDLNLDKKVDFIKVVSKKDGDSYTFILRVDLSKTDSQDVAVILVNRDKDKKVSVQIVGDEDLYGKDYVIEPKTKPTPAVTANPAYQGPDPAKDVPASTTTVVVQSAPIVQYVYSPAYIPYYPPYYYGYYPPYFAMATCVAVGIYRANHYYGGYYGGHYGGGNTVVINNRNQINHYNNNNRSRSNTVSNNMANGNYGNRQGGAAGGNRPSTMPSNNRPSGGAGGAGAGGGNRPSTTPSNNRPSGGASAGSMESNRQSSSRQSSSPSRSSSYSGGGGRSMGGGGGGRGGGGGGRRR